MDEFKSKVIRLSRVTFDSGNIRREVWWPRALKVLFCNFDSFHSKTKMEHPKKRFAHLTEDEIGELVVEKDSKKTPNALRTAVSILHAFCDETKEHLISNEPLSVCIFLYTITKSMHAF